MNFEIMFSGHKNIRSLHTGTIELTRDSDLTPSGDCVIGVNADCACADIPGELRAKLQDASAKIMFTITVDGMAFELEGRGNPAISLVHERDIVIRRSTFVCPRTLAVGANAAADAIPRQMVGALRDPASRGTLLITG